MLAEPEYAIAEDAKKLEIAQSIERFNCMTCGKLLMITEGHFCSHECRRKYAKLHPHFKRKRLKHLRYVTIRNYRARNNLPMACDKCKIELVESDTFVVHKLKLFHKACHEARSI